MSFGKLIAATPTRPLLVNLAFFSLPSSSPSKCYATSNSNSS